MVKRGIKLLIIIIIIYIGKNFIYYKNELIENNNIKNYFKESNNIYEKVLKNDSFISIIEIPKINLKKGLYDKKSKNNNVDNNIQILKESTMPDIKGGNLILVGHSGTGNNAFFNNLNKLVIDDYINIYYQNKKYIYKIVNVYEIEKTGKAVIYDNQNTNLTLITCKDNNKQIIIIADNIKINDIK